MAYMLNPYNSNRNFQAPYNYSPGQQFSGYGQSLYYAPSVLGGQMQHNWALNPDMVSVLQRGLPTPQVQAQAFRMSNESFMTPGGGGQGGPRTVGSAYAPSSYQPPVNAQTQRNALRRRR